MLRRDLTFRVFVSSTFSDLVAERNGLQEHVFPRLRDLCRKHGAPFQAIDLRWGVSDEASLDQQTMNICLEEIRRCQRTTPRPNFIVLLGQRYGWCPLPPLVDAAEFESLLAVLPDAKQLRLKRWYRRDDNAVPAEYCLQPREDGFKDRMAWATEERELRALLREAIVRVGWPANDARRLKYEASATHQEILHGALQVKDTIDDVFGFFRTIDGLPQGATAGDFLDLDPQGRPDAEARARLDRLQAEMRTRLPNNINTYSAIWTGSGPSTEHVGTLPSDLEACKAMLDEGYEPRNLCEAVWCRLGRVMLEEVQRRDRSDLVDQEAIAHSSFGHDRLRRFIGREDALARIREYVQANDRHPLVLHGASGVGKSALMAKAAEKVTSGEWLVASCKPEMVVRYIGATPASSDLRALLEGICKEITLRYGGDAASVPMEVRKLQQDFPERLALATAEKPVVVFLDALDQLSFTDGACDLGWLPRELPANVKLVVSVLEDTAAKGESGGQNEEVANTKDDCLAVLRERLSVENFVRIEPLTAECGALLLDAWLRDAGRTLQPLQRQEVLEKFAADGLPLYLKLAFEEARRWKSWLTQASATVNLSPGIFGILRDLFARLEQPQQHGAPLVSRALGYLATGRHGLTEDELLDVLSTDEVVMADFVHRSPTERAKRSTQLLKALPVLVWSRLRSDLEPYLCERLADGAILLSFYHRQVKEVTRDKYLSGDVKVRSHRHLAAYFRQRADPTRDGQWRGNYVRGLSELPFHLKEGEAWTELENALCNLEFVGAACNALLVDDLIGNLDTALHSPVAARAESRRSLEELRNFVGREGYLLRRYARTPGFVRQHACNKGLSHAQNRGPAGPWFREVRSAEAADGPLLAVLEQHTAHVNECAVAPKAGTIVSTSLDQSVRRWEINSWRQKEIVSILPKGGTSCDISMDGLIVVSGCLDGHVRIHRQDETILCEGNFQKYPSRCRLFADEQRILSIGDSGTVMVHDVAFGRLLTKASLGSDLHACSFNPDGKVALACEDGDVLIYDPTADRITRTIRACAKAFGCAFSSDGRYLVAVGGHDLYLMDVKPYGEVVLFEAPDWHEIARPERKWPELATGCTFLSDGHRYAVAFESGMIRILDALEPDLAVPIKAHSASVRSLVPFISNYGECLLTASADSEIRVWKTAMLTTAKDRVRPEGRAIFCAFSNNTPTAWVWFANVNGFHTDFTAAEYDFTPKSVSRRQIEDLPHIFPGAREFGIFSHDLAPDMPKDLAAISGWQKGSRSVHRSSPFSDWEDYWMVAASARLAKHAFHLVPSPPDGFFAWGNLTWARSVGRQIAILRHNALLIVPPGSAQPFLVPMQHTARPHFEQPQCHYSRDGTRIYIGYANELCVIAASTGESLASCNLLAEVACISESDEGDSLCAGCESGHLVEWNWQTGQQTIYVAHPDGVTDCCYASRHYLVSIGQDGVMRLWERRVQEPRALFPAAASLSALAVSPVDNRIVIADVHGDARFLLLEGIIEEVPKESVLPVAELPTAQQLLHSFLQSDSIIEYLASELVNISSPENLAIVYSMMAHLFDATDRTVADDLRTAAGISKSPVNVLTAAAEVERKTFGPSDTIVQVSQVIRGMARVLNATRTSDFDYALDVTRRFVWPRTKITLLLATYGIAEAANRRDTMKAIMPIIASTS